MIGYSILFEGMIACSVVFLDLFISTLLGICISMFIPGYLSSTMSWLLRFVFFVFPCGCGYCLISLSELKTFPELREMLLGKVTKSWNKLFYVLLFCGYCMAYQLKYLFYIEDFLKMLHWRTKLFASYITCHYWILPNASYSVYARLTFYTHFYWTPRTVQTVMHVNLNNWRKHWIWRRDHNTVSASRTCYPVTQCYVPENRYLIQPAVRTLKHTGTECLCVFSERNGVTIHGLCNIYRYGIAWRYI